MRLLTLLTVLIFISCNNTQSNNIIKGDIKKIKTSIYSASEKFGDPVIGDLVEITEQEYNDKGQLIAEPLYFDVEIFGITKYKYNEAGKKSEELDYSIEGEVDFTTVFEYNDDNLLISESRHNKYNELRYVVKYKYSDNGKKIRESKYNGNGDLKNVMDFEYNNKGQLTKRTLYDKSGKLSYIEEFEYNTANQVTQQRTYDDLQQYEGRLIYAYDKNNLLLTKSIQMSDEDEPRCAELYQYPKIDKEGNWTERFELFYGKVIQITKREIEYR